MSSKANSLRMIVILAISVVIATESRAARLELNKPYLTTCEGVLEKTQDGDPENARRSSH